jgi:hypothetical protein
VCEENIETTAADGRIIRIGVIATNICERNESNRWLLIHHHGSPVKTIYRLTYLLNENSYIIMTV